MRDGGGIDANQVVAYDVAHAAAAVGTARAALAVRRARGDSRRAIAAAFVADVVADLAGQGGRARGAWGVEAGVDARRRPTFLEAQRDPAVLAGLATTEGPRHLGRRLRAGP